MPADDVEAGVIPVVVANRRCLNADIHSARDAANGRNGRRPIEGDDVRVRRLQQWVEPGGIAAPGRTEPIRRDACRAAVRPSEVHARSRVRPGRCGVGRSRHRAAPPPAWAYRVPPRAPATAAWRRPRSSRKRSCGSATDCSTRCRTRPACPDLVGGHAQARVACRLQQKLHAEAASRVRRAEPEARSDGPVRAGPSPRVERARDVRHVDPGVRGRERAQEEVSFDRRAEGIAGDRVHEGRHEVRHDASGGRPSRAPSTISARQDGGMDTASWCRAEVSSAAGTGSHLASPSAMPGRNRPRAVSHSAWSRARASQRREGVVHARRIKTSMASSGSISRTGTRHGASVGRPRRDASIGSHGDGRGVCARVGSRSCA